MHKCPPAESSDVELSPCGRLGEGGGQRTPVLAYTNYQQEMSRRRDRRNKRPYSRQKPTSAPEPKPQVGRGISKFEKKAAVLVGILLLAGVGLMWQQTIQHKPDQTQPPSSRTAIPAAPTAEAPGLHSNLQSTASRVDLSTNAAKLERSAIELNQQAIKMMNAGDIQGPIDIYEKAVKLSPEDEDLHYNLGIAYAKLGNFAKAEEHYREALRLLPDYAEVHNNFGNLLLRAGRLEEAAEQLQEAIKLQPEYAAAHNNLGIVRQKQKRLPEAAACFEKAIEYDTNYLEAHFNLASASLAGGNHEKAIAEFRQTLRIDPAFEPAQRGLAKAMAQ